MIKILIDITPLQTDSKDRGIGRVVAEFVSRLIEDEKNNSNVYLLKYSRISLFDNYPRLIEIKPGFFERLKLSYMIKKNNISVYLCTESLLPLIKISSFKTITIIYDIIPVLFKYQMFRIYFEKIHLLIKKRVNNKVEFITTKIIDFFNNKFINSIAVFFRFRLYLIKLNRIVSKSDHYIFISDCTKNDFSKYLNQVLDHMDKTVYLGFYSQENDNNSNKKCIELLGRYKLKTKKYFYYIGAYDYRKNISAMVEIFSIFKNKHSDVSIDYKLVLMGNINDLTKKQLMYYAEKENISDSIIFTGYLPDEDVSCIIHNSKLFLFTSLYEGFGLPIIEAMNHKIPVISFSNSCIPEICSNAAILINNQNKVEFVSSIVRLVNDTVFYNDMVKKGYARSHFFSWDKAKDEIVLMYNEVSEKYFKI